MQAVFLKDPAAVLDWYFDWAGLRNGTGESDWLAGGETITQYTITVTPTGENGLDVQGAEMINGATAVRVWLASGEAGVTYRLACLIETSAGRQDERTATVKVRQR